MMNRTTVIPAMLTIASMSCVAIAAANDRRSYPHVAPEVDQHNESPAERDARMKWWREAKFGMFIHWGIYSSAGGMWKGKPVRGIGEWLMHNDKIPSEEYKVLATDFNPVKFDGAEWAKIAADAGCKYMVITSKHHDGFSMFDTKLSDFDIVDGTPYKKDPMVDLAKGCKDNDIKFCFYHSILDWKRAPKGETWPPYVNFMKGQLKELLTNYGPLGVMWFDGEWDENWTEEQGKELYAYCRGLQPSLIINNRVGKARDDMAGISLYKGAGDYDTPEQEVPGRGLPGIDWETCMTMNDTWGYKIHDVNWKSTDTLLRTLADVVSKGGNFLLNVGPTAEGLIPPESVERLAEMGKWMKVNGEAIYGTMASPFVSLPWGRCTSKGNDLYLIVLDWPESEKDKPATLLLPGLNALPTSLSFLGDATPITAARDPRGVMITLPVSKPTLRFPVIKLTYAYKTTVTPIATHKSNGGQIVLDAPDATLTGPTLERKGRRPNIGNWTSGNGAASWVLAATKPGRYKVSINYARDPGNPVTVAPLLYLYTSTNPAAAPIDAAMSAPVPATKSWDDFENLYCGMIDLAADKPATLTVRSAPGYTPAAGTGFINIRSVTLSPVD
jgi:alpha-L-fucosidase